jgi:hypothetical protein
VAFSIAAKWSVGAFDHTAEIISPAISFHRYGLFSRLGVGRCTKAHPASSLISLAHTHTSQCPAGRNEPELDFSTYSHKATYPALALVHPCTCVQIFTFSCVVSLHAACNFLCDAGRERCLPAFSLISAPGARIIISAH